MNEQLSTDTQLSGYNPRGRVSPRLANSASPEIRSYHISASRRFAATIFLRLGDSQLRGYAKTFAGVLSLTGKTDLLTKWIPSLTGFQEC